VFLLSFVKQQRKILILGENFNFYFFSREISRDQFVYIINKIDNTICEDNYGLYVGFILKNDIDQHK